MIEFLSFILILKTFYVEQQWSCEQKHLTWKQQALGLSSIKVISGNRIDYNNYMLLCYYSQPFLEITCCCTCRLQNTDDSTICTIVQNSVKADQFRKRFLALLQREKVAPACECWTVEHSTVGLYWEKVSCNIEMKLFNTTIRQMLNHMQIVYH